MKGKVYPKEQCCCIKYLMEICSRKNVLDFFFFFCSSVVRSFVFVVPSSVILTHVMCCRRCNISSSSMSTRSRKKRERPSLPQQTRFLSGKIKFKKTQEISKPSHTRLTITSKSKIHIFPLTCSSVYSARLF